MQKTNNKLAVIYANDENIWDNNKKQFHHCRRTVDESSYSMALEEAQSILQRINNQRLDEGEDEAYIIELEQDEQDDIKDIFNTLAEITKPTTSNMHPIFAQALKPFGIR